MSDLDEVLRLSIDIPLSYEYMINYKEKHPEHFEYIDHFLLDISYYLLSIDNCSNCEKNNICVVQQTDNNRDLCDNCFKKQLESNWK